jgi:hypothetical protein
MTGNDTSTALAQRGVTSEQELREIMISLHKNLDLGKIIEREDKVRSDQVRSDVASRLKKACCHLQDAEFAALVDKITAVQLRGERRPR